MPNMVETEALMRKRGGWHCRAGWALFALSLMLPASYGMPGWFCAWFVFDIAWDWIAGRSEGLGVGWGLYYSGFALMNIILVASPLYFRLLRHDLRWLRRGALLAGFATLYVVSYWVLIACLSGLKELGNLHVGYYAWVVSFATMTAGALHLSMRRPRNFVNVRPPSMVRTWEEIAAIRELEDHLNGVDVPRKEVLPQVEAVLEPVGLEQAGVG
jgi:hypothetical protein